MTTKLGKKIKANFALLTVLLSSSITLATTIVPAGALPKSNINNTNSFHIAKVVDGEGTSETPTQSEGTSETPTQSEGTSGTPTDVEKIPGLLTPPPVVGTKYLAEAGMPDPDNLFNKITDNCTIDVKAKWPFGKDKQTCLYTAPQGYLILGRDTKLEEKQRTCSIEADEFSSDGAVVKSREEIEQIYDVAAKLAVKDKSIVDGLLKMRNYHLRVYDFASNRGTHRVVISAKAGAAKRAVCGGYANTTAIRL